AGVLGDGLYANGDLHPAPDSIQGLATDEDRLALLDESGHAFPRVLGGEQLAEVRGLRVEVLAVIAGKGAVGRGLGSGKRDRARGGEQARDLHRLLEQLRGLEDGVDEAVALRLVGIDHTASEDQLLGVAEGCRPGHPLGTAPARDDPEIDLRLADLRRAGCVAQVAGDRELAAPAEREAVDRGDRRLRHRLEQPRRLVPERAPRLRFVDTELAHVPDVRTSGERLLAGARQDDDPRIGIVGELVESVPQLSQRRKIERVERILSVDGDEDDAEGRLLRTNAQAATLSRRKSTISDVGAPGVKTSATPCCFSSSASAVGIVPPTTTRTSSAPFSLSPSRIRGTRVMCAPERIEIPTASASSWMAVSTICSGV